MSDERDDTEGTVDLAHDALITGWPIIRTWAGQFRLAERERRRFEDMVANWQQLKEQGGFLEEAELALAERWLDGPDATEIGYSVELSELVEASRARIEAEQQHKLDQARALAEERQRRAEEQAAASETLAEEQRLRAEESDKAAKLRGWLLLATGGIAILALLAFVAASLFFQQAREGRDNAISALATAEAEALARATAEANAQANAEVSLTQALAAQSQVVADASGEDETAALLAVQASLLDQAHHQVEGPIGSALQNSIGSPFFSTQSLGHQSMVGALAYSRDGRILAVVRDDGSLQLQRDGTEVTCALPRGDGPLRAIAAAFNHDDTWLASGSGDGRVRLWRIAADACTFDHDLEGPGGLVWGIAWAGTADAPVLAASGCAMQAAEPPPRFERAPECPGQTGEIRTWSFDPVTASLTDDTPGTLPMGGKSVCTLAASPDGRWLAASTCGEAAGEPDCPASVGSVVFWDLAAGTPAGQCALAHEGIVNSLASASCNGQAWFVAGSADRSISLWTFDGDQIRRVTPLTGQKEAVRSVALSRDCTWLAAGSEDGTTGLWYIADIMRTGMPVEPAPIMIPLGTSTQWVRTVAFGGEQGMTLVAESTLGRYRQWDLGFGDTLAPSVDPAHTSYIRALAFSPVANSLVVASAAEDGTIRVWNAADPNGTPISIDLDGPDQAALKVTSVALSPDGTMVAAGTERGGYQLWRLICGASAVLVPAGTIPCDDNREAMVAFSPDGSLLAVGGCNGAILLLDPTTGNALPTQIDPATKSNITALAFNHNGSMLAAGTLDGTIALWTWTGDHFALAGQAPGHSGRVWTLAFHPDGDLLASGGPERNVMLWRVSAGGLAADRSLPGHANAVRALTFSPDGSLLFSGSRDQTVRIWNATDFDASPVAILDLAEWVRAIAISSDGSVLAAASDQGMIRLIVPHSDTLAHSACERIAREPLSQAEWDRFVGSTLAYQDICAELAEDTESRGDAPLSDRTAVLPPRGGTGISRRQASPT